jgi:SAM-dependent methyltransferase
MSKMQNILSSIMQRAGKAVEKTASLFQGTSAKPKRTGVEDTQGHDFGYIQWNEKQIHSLLTAAERKQLLPLIPPLETKRSLHLTPGKENYVAPMAKRGAQNLIEMDVSRNPTSGLGIIGSHLKVRGGVDRFPFPEDSFDFILYPSALAWRADLPALFPESARCIAENGRLLLSIVHPFFEYLMNPRGGFKKSVETIFENLKKNHFLIEELKEGTLEDAMRSVSLPPKMQKDLQRFAALPVILVIKGIRLRKKKPS